MNSGASSRHREALPKQERRDVALLSVPSVIIKKVTMP